MPDLNLRERREALGLNLDEVASLIGIPMSRIYRHPKMGLCVVDDDTRHRMHAFYDFIERDRERSALDRQGTGDLCQACFEPLPTVEHVGDEGGVQISIERGQGFHWLVEGNGAEASGDSHSRTCALIDAKAKAEQIRRNGAS